MKNYRYENTVAVWVIAFAILAMLFIATHAEQVWAFLRSL